MVTQVKKVKCDICGAVADKPVFATVLSSKNSWLHIRFRNIGLDPGYGDSLPAKDVCPNCVPVVADLFKAKSARVEPPPKPAPSKSKNTIFSSVVV